MLRNYLEENGQVLFRRRGWLPLFVLLAVPSAFQNHTYPSHRHSLQEAWTVLCMGVALSGLLLRFITIAHVPPRTSGRNRREQVADSLNTEGTYSIVRNPLYLGNCLCWLGLAAVPQALWQWVCVALVFWIYHERIILAEESFLERKFGEKFRSWASQTPAFIPNFRLWRNPTLQFSFRNALGREYVNLFAMISAFAAFEVIADSAAERRLHIDWSWAVAWGLALVLFGVVRFLKKRTTVLSVEGRAW